jgi:tetratricopeptide (TPR) repeat protein
VEGWLSPETWRARSRPARAGALVLLAGALLGGARAPQVPPLPTLPWADYPAETRAAIEPAYNAAESRPLDAAAAGTLARTLQAWRDLEAAHQTYRRAQALAPGTFEWYYLDGIVLQRLARPADAAGAFRRALLSASGYLPARVRLADALLQSGQLEESAKLYDALRDDPLAEVLARFGLGRIAAMEGRHAEAVAHLTRALDIFPEWGEAYYVLAMSLVSLERPDEAAKALASHARFPTTVPRLEDPVLASTSALRNDAVANLERGARLKADGDLTGAIEAHEAAVARDPDYAQAHANLISLYSEAGNWAKVEAHYRAVVALGFGLATANFDYGVAQERQGHLDLAEAAYRRSIAINPDHTGARGSLGRLLERKRDFEAAAAEFRRALESRPTDRVARYDLARMLVNLRRPAEAIPEFERVLEPRDDTAPAVLLGLAVALALTGETEQADRRFDEAHTLATSYGRTDLIQQIEAAKATLAKVRPR